MLSKLAFEPIKVDLPSGVLTVVTHHSRYPTEQLLDYASRLNPKRGFLFVSRVLGRHIPVKPSVSRIVTRELASELDIDLPGPVLFIAMAETAIGLGQAVFEDYSRLSGREDLVFIHSTRYRLDREIALEFVESHSHATDHIVYLPQEKEHRRLFERARSLVIVDDEASTGNTLVNLSRACCSRIQSLEQVRAVVITDWRSQNSRAANRQSIPVDFDTVSILDGEYSFKPNPDALIAVMPPVTGNGELKDFILEPDKDWGRLGTCGIVADDYIETLVDGVNLNPHEKILVLGTGEFSYPPFLLAEALEKRGSDVRFQCLTRSPIREGFAIGSSMAFLDNYDDGITNFIYNVTAGQYDRVLICHETPASCMDPDLVHVLGAEFIHI